MTDQQLPEQSDCLARRIALSKLLVGAWGVATLWAALAGFFAGELHWWPLLGLAAFSALAGAVAFVSVVRMLRSLRELERMRRAGNVLRATVSLSRPDSSL